MVASERKACGILASRDLRCFCFRVSHSATQNLAAGQYVETVIAFAGIRCVARCWPHAVLEGEQGWIKLSLVILSTGGHQKGAHQAPKSAAAHIQLRTTSGQPAHKVRQGPPEIADFDGDSVCLGATLLFASRDEVEKDCVVDDHFAAICTVAVLRDCWPPPALPLPRHVGTDILNMHDLSDVTFQVEGETFRAHRLVLAACSPVFKAELFGEMMEATASSITINDMRAATFCYMLRYMYCGTLTDVALGMNDASGMAELQHLFVAAHRYGLESLKETCEEMMCSGIKISVVLSALEFAEENASPKLKSKCLDLLSVPENFQEVAATDEYLTLMNTFPPLLAQVQGRFCKRARRE